MFSHVIKKRNQNLLCLLSTQRIKHNSSANYFIRIQEFSLLMFPLMECLHKDK